MKKDFLSILDLTAKEIKEIIADAKVMKNMRMWGESPRPLEGKKAILIFRKPSLRTRASFEIGITELGGTSYTFHEEEIQIGKRESVSDAARVFSRYCDLIIIRTYAQREVEELARYSSVPVINALTDLLHPCQILSDVYTIVEKKGAIEGISIAYVGDGNNIAHSWLNLSCRIPIDLRIATPPQFAPVEGIVENALKSKVSRITITNNPVEAVKGADVVYTDVWASMGQKHLAEEKALVLRDFQVNSELVKHAKPDYIFMHCLPAERGKEVTDEIIDSPNSVVFDQAENRLHVQKALMAYMFK